MSQEKEKNPIFEYAERLKRGEKIPCKKTKLKVPYKADGTEDWDNAETIKVTYE